MHSPVRRLQLLHVAPAGPSPCKPEELRVALFSGNYNYVRDGANQALNRLASPFSVASGGAGFASALPTVQHPAFLPTGVSVGKCRRFQYLAEPNISWASPCPVVSGAKGLLRSCQPASLRSAGYCRPSRPHLGQEAENPGRCIGSHPLRYLPPILWAPVSRASHAGDHAPLLSVQHAIAVPDEAHPRRFSRAQRMNREFRPGARC